MSLSDDEFVTAKDTHHHIRATALLFVASTPTLQPLPTLLRTLPQQKSKTSKLRVDFMPSEECIV